MKRAIIMVLDSLGVGELPDAAKYGDAGSDTLGHIAEHAKNFHPQNLIDLGIGCIDGVNPAVPKTDAPKASYAKMKEKRDGYDSCSGNGTFRDRTGHGIGRDKEPVGRRPA